MWGTKYPSPHPFLAPVVTKCNKIQSVKTSSLYQVLRVQCFYIIFIYPKQHDITTGCHCWYWYTYSCLCMHLCVPGATHCWARCMSVLVASHGMLWVQGSMWTWLTWQDPSYSATCAAALTWSTCHVQIWFRYQQGTYILFWHLDLRFVFSSPKCSLSFENTRTWGSPSSGTLIMW